VSYCVIAEEEKNMVAEVFSNAIDALSDEDKSLPQVRRSTSGIVRCLCHFVLGSSSFLARKTVSDLPA